MKKQIILKLKSVVLLLAISVTAHAKKLKVAELVVEPQSIQTTFDQEHEVTVHGGQPPYIFKTSAGMIRYKDNTATYISPNAPGDATITVKDANGLSKSIVITIISDPKTASSAPVE